MQNCEYLHQKTGYVISYIPETSIQISKQYMYLVLVVQWRENQKKLMALLFKRVVVALLVARQLYVSWHF